MRRSFSRSCNQGSSSCNQPWCKNNPKPETRSCNAGYSRAAGLNETSPGLCPDIDECTTGAHDCDESVFETCVNSVGSYRCPRTRKYAKCKVLSPTACTVDGGRLDWIDASANPNSTSNVTSVGFNGTGLAAPATVAGALISALCPPSPTVGRHTGLVRNYDGSTFCDFDFTYTPRPAAISPRRLPLAGGTINVSLDGYARLYGPIRCRLQVALAHACFYGPVRCHLQVALAHVPPPGALAHARLYGHVRCQLQVALAHASAVTSAATLHTSSTLHTHTETRKRTHTQTKARTHTHTHTQPVGSHVDAHKELAHTHTHTHCH